MFFVFEEGLTMLYTIGGASKLETAKKLAEKRCGKKLDWKSIEDGEYEAVLDYGTYKIWYVISTQGKRQWKQR